MTMVHGLKAAAALTLAAGWAVLGHSLYFGETDARAIGDLEAGGRFAANFSVFGPYLLGTLVVLVVVIGGLFPRTTPVMVAAVGLLGCLFALWVRGQDFLFTAFPDVYDAAAVAVLACGAAALVACAAWLVARARQVGAATGS